MSAPPGPGLRRLLVGPRTLGLMPGIVSGRSWLANRRRFLEDELTKDPSASSSPSSSPEQRAAMEAELAAVNEELATSRRRWWHALLWGARPPV